MRKKYIVGNWKMNTTLAQAKNIVTELAYRYKDYKNNDIEIVICPPYVWLHPIAEILSGTNIKLGAQNTHYELKGAYTGEISPNMLCEIGCKYVIIGHSERRIGLGESEADINRKLHSATNNQLNAILCIGETLAERERNLHKLTIQRQIFSACAGLSKNQLDRLLIAYEPVWSIGTGKVANTDVIVEIQEHIRFCMSLLYKDQKNIDEISILYGGSVNRHNSCNILSSNEMDGLLIGGASIDLAEFIEIIENTLKLSNKNN